MWTRGLGSGVQTEGKAIDLIFTCFTSRRRRRRRSRSSSSSGRSSRSRSSSRSGSGRSRSRSGYDAIVIIIVVVVAVILVWTALFCSYTMVSCFALVNLGNFDSRTVLEGHLCFVS